MTTTIQTTNWFYSAGGQVKGPVSLEEFCDILRSGVLNGKHDLAWNEGMNDWKRLDTIPEIAHSLSIAKKRSTPIPITSEARNAPNAATSVFPPVPPSDLTDHRKPQTSQPALQSDSTHRTVGVSRGNYVGSLVLVVGGVCGVFGIQHFFQADLPENAKVLNYLFPVVCFFAIFYAMLQTVRRFQNVGMSPWWLLSLPFLPGVNLWAGYRLFAAPSDYTQMRRMDFKGYLATAVYLAPILCLSGIVIYLASHGHNLETITLVHGSEVQEICSGLVPEIESVINRVSALAGSYTNSQK